MSADTIPNYLNALEDHTKDDIKIDIKALEIIETTMNDHLSHFNIMFMVGSAHNHEKRVREAII